MSALALSPSYQAELAGSLLLHQSEMATRKTDGFLAVCICSNLAFFGSVGYWSACHYEGPVLVPGQLMWNQL